MLSQIEGNQPNHDEVTALQRSQFGVCLGENRADERSAHLRLLARDLRESVAQQVDAGALPDRTLHRLTYRRLHTRRASEMLTTVEFRAHFGRAYSSQCRNT